MTHYISARSDNEMAIVGVYYVPYIFEQNIFFLQNII